MQSTLHKVVCYLTSTVCFIDFDSFGMFLLFKNEGLCVCHSLQCPGVRQWELLLQGLKHPPSKISHL